jgi:hypothetical protein
MARCVRCRDRADFDQRSTGVRQHRSLRRVTTEGEDRLDLRHFAGLFSWRSLGGPPHCCIPGFRQPSASPLLLAPEGRSDSREGLGCLPTGVCGTYASHGRLGYGASYMVAPGLIRCPVTGEVIKTELAFQGFQTPIRSGKVSH